MKLLLSRLMMLMLLLNLIWVQQLSAENLVLKVGGTNHPLSSIKVNGKHTGIIADVYREMVREVDQKAKLDFFIAEPEELRQEIIAGNLDLNFSVVNENLLDNAVIVYIPEPREIKLWSLPSKPVHPDQDLTKLRMGTVQSYVTSSFFKDVSPVVFESTSALVEALIKKQVDAVLAMDYLFRYSSYSLGYSSEQFVHYTIDSTPIVLWTHEKSVVYDNLAEWQAAAEKSLAPQKTDQRWLEFLESLASN